MLQSSSYMNQQVNSRHGTSNYVNQVNWKINSYTTLQHTKWSKNNYKLLTLSAPARFKESAVWWPILFSLSSLVKFIYVMINYYHLLIIIYLLDFGSLDKRFLHFFECLEKFFVIWKLFWNLKTKHRDVYIHLAGT